MPVGAKTILSALTGVCDGVLHHRPGGFYFGADNHKTGRIAGLIFGFQPHSMRGREALNGWQRCAFSSHSSNEGVKLMVATFYLRTPTTRIVTIS